MITLPIDRIDEAPLAPGLYCWFAKPDFEMFDNLIEAFDSDAKLMKYVTDDFYELVQASIPQDLQASLNAPFGTVWGGPLKARMAERKGQSPKKKTENACAKKSELVLLSNLLRATFPAFWAPLYTGVAVNLRSRLHTHRRAYSAYLLGEEEYCNSEPSNDDEAQSRDLAARLKACGYRPEQLTICLFPIEGVLTTTEMTRVRKIAEAAESWLNHFNLPRLGKL